MFCPKCATQNADDARFCRSCGVDISLVPQVITGALAERLAAAEEARDGRRRRHGGKGDRPPSVERAFRGIFMGLAFIAIAFAVRTWAPAGHVWWFWMFIPAALNLADGLSTYMRLASGGKGGAAATSAAPTTALPPQRVGALPPRNTGEMIPPPSVTEGTTRHLAVPVERKRGE